jgi:RHS repeat-associated protein
MKTHDVRTARDPSDDYIYGPSSTPVEEVSLSSSTPSYMTYMPSDSSWLITNAAGDEIAFYGYDAFGNLAFGTPGSPFGYAGEYTDPSTGFSNLRARWYETQVGAFTTRDPAFASTDTAYIYAGDDPVNETDPTGLEDVLGNHATCQDVNDGQSSAKLCVQVNTSAFLGENERSEPQAVWIVTSGTIEKAGATLLNMEVCGSHGPYPGHPRSCHQNDDPTNSPSATCGGQECYLNGGWYTNSEVNWEDAWVEDAWFTLKDDPCQKKVAVSLHETPLCRIGNGGSHVCDPNW